ncbi:YhbY family RNA-binding protein [Haloarcula salinisoli]|uniref:YhbY family RNA-binding protein n=1 Tax=Haloarcula salinisoli TaxID=2487746 RepID=A0A8J7YE16_9EURY|nr:YhbY family RNA-binding protein [Halomicroarcula salinisoli]MBX0284759.1 YhbY family RNA-binding protein [Halomicroarcula salinisoli]MBX0303782.1 YhbY family RNA-binding protein [Halomicroarcula salinisoli]
MPSKSRKQRIHDLDATLRVGKNGIESVADELGNQLEDSQFVKVKFLRAARGGTTTEELADDLADHVSADVVQVRGHTAVFER